MTYTVYMLVSRKPGTTLEQFKNHYETSHVPLIMDCLKDVLPTTHTRYYLKRNDAIKGNTEVAPPLVFAGDASTVDYDCLTQIEFRDEEHFGQFNQGYMNSPRRAEIEADEGVFADRSKLRIFAVESPEITKN